MGEIYQWMKNIVYFLLVVGIMRNLTGREYQKYASLTVGLCLVLLVASPFMKYMAGDEFQNNLSYYFQKDNLEGSLAWEGISGNEEGWKQEVLSQYSQRIKEQAQELLKGRGLTVTRAELLLEEGSTITGMTIWVSRKTDGAAGQDGRKEIAPVSITDIVISLEPKEGGSQEKESGTAGKAADSIEIQLLKQDIKSELADFYDMDASHINIIIS